MFELTGRTGALPPSCRKQRGSDGQEADQAPFKFMMIDGDESDDNDDGDDEDNDDDDRQSSSIGGGCDDATSSVSSENLWDKIPSS